MLLVGMVADCGGRSRRLQQSDALMRCKEIENSLCTDSTGQQKTCSSDEAILSCLSVMGK